MHKLNWTLGNNGRGLIDQNGEVHTFNEGEYPTHAHYEKEHNLGATGYFYIGRDGQVDLTYPHRQYDASPECDAAIHTITGADPTLYEPAHYTPADNDAWNFGRD